MARGSEYEDPGYEDPGYQVRYEDPTTIRREEVPAVSDIPRVPNRLRIAVLTGGANTERNVSLSSGTAVVRALRGLGHAVAQVDSAASPIVPDQPPASHFLTAEVDEDDVPETPIGPSVVAPPDLEALAQVRAGQEGGVLAPGLLPILEHADVVFLTVFGDEGESGATQRHLDAHGIAYTGPSADVCELTFDKAATKEALVDHGVQTPRWQVVRRDAVEADLADLDVEGPWIVKPVAGGSTIGLSHVEDASGLPAAIAKATAAGTDALVEEFVPGRDFTIGVLGEQVFAVVEAMTDRDLYDYTAKYTPGASNKKVPADLSAEQTAELRELTGRVHRLLGVGDTCSRSDFRLGPDGRFTFFEINPLPGLTPTSSYPISALAEGLAFPELCEEIAYRALARHGSDSDGADGAGSQR